MKLHFKFEAKSICYATSIRHRISLWNSSYFHISNFSPLFWRQNAISFKTLQVPCFTFNLQLRFTISNHLCSDVKISQNVYINQRKTDVSGWNVILQVTLVSRSQVTFVPMSKFCKSVLIKGKTTLNQRWCDFTKQILFLPLLCRRNAMSFQPLKSPSYHRRNGMLFSNQNFWNSGEMRQKVIQIFKTVAKYNGESPSKIETKTNILQISKQWHISLSHRQQNFVQDFSHWVLKLVKDGL